jgi:hypothetical protein
VIPTQAANAFICGFSTTICWPKFGKNGVILEDTSIGCIGNWSGQKYISLKPRLEGGAFPLWLVWLEGAPVSKFVSNRADPLRMVIESRHRQSHLSAVR